MNLLLGLSFALCVLSGQSAMVDKATGIDFSPKLNGLSLFGVGVRKKGPIKIYSVGMYISEMTRETLSSGAKKLESIRSSVKSNPPTTFLLKMNFKVPAAKMASAIAESVVPRHTGDASDVKSLEELIFDGVSAKGAATKGTTLQFDCEESGIDVTVDGKLQGSVNSPKLSQSFCDVYLDDKGVSPAFKASCLESCIS